jgi:hypothetical protein
MGTPPLVYSRTGLAASLLPVVRGVLQGAGPCLGVTTRMIWGRAPLTEGSRWRPLSTLSFASAAETKLAVGASGPGLGHCRAGSGSPRWARSQRLRWF